ncbi:cysteine peptidase family C39 domain-containing protein [Wansuia hejianensis]|uniref:Uncharacterized protein n=1 Tax=Wansuia hejianensis TaxID=2763667 RepID=A0A7G9GAJ3_9FIRM|nr:hypothetical protein [Wansuia hejianensis]QNM07825.1 hypothetical protein H9Q79_13005 [Wansuia hejianensis]RHV83977.1 hypothetical protein DXA96_19600 [Lachnospiraceae bacterium OF09-33XD]
MKRFLIKAGVLIGVFIAGVILFSNILNRKETANTKGMEYPTLPVMYMVEAETTVNRMFGYRQEVEERAERESLTLLPTDRTLTLQLQPFDCKVQGISYQVTSLEDGSLVENGKVKNLTGDGSLQLASFKLDTPILMNQEYMLRFTVDIGAETPVYYYTRLVQRGGLNVGEYLKFVQNFYETCLNKEMSGDLASYLEPDSSASNSSFHNVTIHSSLDQVTWGSLGPELVKKAVPVIKEANETTVSVSMEYLISAKDSEGNTEYYGVQEFYRMRNSQDQIILLDFERSAEQVFDGTLPVLTDTGINLGVTGKDVQYVSNQSADIVAFVTSGELWSYNRSANKATKVFGFRSAGTPDERTENLNHEIKISKVAETGDISFVVFGYMSAGDHEGRLGISVYSYSAEQNVAEEKMFIPVSTSWEVMQQSLSMLSYVNGADMLYLYLGDSLYQINLQDAVCTVLQDDMNPDCFVVSDSQQSVAWMEEMDENSSSHVTVMSLETGKTMEVSAPAGEKVKALGFINEDFVYGLAHDTDIVSDVAGNITFAMYRICIQNIDGEIAKEYQKDGVYVTAVKRKEGLLELERATRTGGGFTPADSDHIMNNIQNTEETVSIRLNVSERKGTQVAIVFTVNGKTKNLLVLKTQYIDKETVPEAVLELPAMSEDVYYVYGKGRLQNIFTKVNDAVKEADEQVGVVLNGRQQYVWERGNTKSSVKLETSGIPEGILQAPIDEASVQQSLGEGYTVLNLTGCSLDNIYYQISNGYPVIAKISAEETAVIIGYDIYNIWLFTPATQEVKPVASDDAETLLASLGNVFVSYREDSDG